MPIQKEFFRNVLPSMVAFAFSGVYSIVDGIFVGRNIGDIGLSAINLAYPITALIQATGAGLGMAGAIALSIRMGHGDEDGQRDDLGNTFTLLLLAGALMTALLSLLSTPLLLLFGARGELLALCREYIGVIVLGCAFQILGTGLIPLLRVYDGAVPAMRSMMTGFTANIALNYLFIVRLQWGTAGAALSTVIAQGLTAGLALRFLLVTNGALRHARLRPTWRRTRWLLVTALSPFGLTLSPNFTIILMNRFGLALGGDRAVACYAIISYAVYVAQLLLQGVGDGAQPLLGRYYGAGDAEGLSAVRRLTFSTAPLVVCLSVVALFAARQAVPALFGASTAAGAMYQRVLPWFLLGLLFQAFARSFTAYFYATERARSAALLIYGEPTALLALILCLTPAFRLTGVWMAVPTVQLLLAAGGLLLLNGPRLRLALPALPRPRLLRHNG